MVVVFLVIQTPISKIRKKLVAETPNNHSINVSFLLPIFIRGAGVGENNLIHFPCLGFTGVAKMNVGRPFKPTILRNETMNAFFTCDFTNIYYII